MILTTLCYIEQDNHYLMLHRIKKKQDINQGKWIGVGGKAEFNETPDECMLREVKEETGLTLTQYRLRGIITFSLDGYDTEYMFLYTAAEYLGKVNFDCCEGVLKWIPKEQLFELNLWEGDKIFLKLLQEDSPLFSLKLHYSEANELIESKLTLL